MTTKYRNCTIQRGFFVLRDCAKPGEMRCPACQRAVCGEHRRSYGGRELCVECAAREHRKGIRADEDDATAWGLGLTTYQRAFDAEGADADWQVHDGVMAYREQFYASTSHDADEFTPSDFAAFDANPSDDADDVGPDFFDS